jgi:hypothetical protein
VSSHEGASAVSQSADAVHAPPTRAAINHASNDRWLRLPTWADHTEGGAPVPSAMTVPIYSKAF